MTTTANVCDLCAAINKPHILETGDLPRSRTWQQSLVFLSDNANGKLLGHEQCAFWKLVWDGITSFHSNLDLSFNVSVRRDDLEHGTGPLVVTVQQLNRPDLQFYTPVGAGRSPWEAIGRGYSISPFGLSESCTRLMRGWLEECTASQGKHSQCTAPILPYLPSRVIDVELLHLHCAQPGEKAHYVALSHCWGGQSPIQTTMQNLDAHIAGLPPLPQTFADAVAVTKALGTRYLWIDSLCIVQNSPEDWHAEVTKMAEVYENAFFTISADAAASATDGFLRPPSRSFTPETPIPYTSMCGNSSTTTTTTSFLASGTILVRERGTQALMLPFHSPVPPPPTPTQPSTRPLPRLIPISKLSTRGWVFQERVLAPRTLHFSRSETAWECPSLCTCECSATSARNHLRTSLLKDFFTTAAGVSPPRSRQRPPPDERWRREIVQEYSRLDLTVPTDRLVALGGLAARMARLRGGGDEYLAGLWRGTLGRDLLWYCVHEREKDKDKAGGRIRPYCAPSWSWAGMTGGVAYAWDERVDRVSDTFGVKGVDVEGQGTGDKFGSVREGAYIVVSGVCVRVRPIRVGAGEMKLRIVKRQSRLRRLVTGAEERERESELLVVWDTAVTEGDLHGEFLFLMIAEGKNHPFGILLKKKKERDEAYERVAYVGQRDATPWNLDRRGSFSLGEVRAMEQRARQKAYNAWKDWAALGSDMEIRMI